MTDQRRLFIVVLDRSTKEVVSDLTRFREWMDALGVSDDDFLSVEVTGTNGYTALQATLGYSSVMESVAALRDPGPLYGPDTDRMRHEIHTAMAHLADDGFSLRPELYLSGAELVTHFEGAWSDGSIPIGSRPIDVVNRKQSLSPQRVVGHRDGRDKKSGWFRVLLTGLVGRRSR